MNIYEDIKTCPTFNHAVVTIGFFDGIHKGHQYLLARLRENAKKNNGETILVTFWPHPKVVLKPNNPPVQLLNTFTEKANLLAGQKIQHILKIPFTKQFSEMSSEDFIKDILVRQIGTKKLVIGYDHRFGKNKQGDIKQLESYGAQYGFDVEQIPRQDTDNMAVGSSHIRRALVEGYPETASRLLGRLYSIAGKVIEGNKLGRKIGFPTANLSISSPYKLIPKQGVYAATIRHRGNMHGGMLYIGTRPTINGKGQQSIEINIFDFDKDIYGEEVQINLVSLIREDAHFDTLEALKAQIQNDKDSSTTLLHKKKLV